MRPSLVLLLLSLFLSMAAYAQHEGHEHHEHNGHDTSGMNMSGKSGHDHGAMTMAHAFSKNLPMARNGSGTSWLPDQSPVYAYMIHSSKWMYMVHGNVFLRVNKQDLFNLGSRGGQKADAPNMWMFMGQRNVGKHGLFHFSSMISFDPITIGKSGYPLLFQTGETYKGQPLIDRQHPHDLISELSISYAHALSADADLFVYLGYPGEPALGPVAFVHRPSGFFNPDAPLTHHWVDATHITFGVATVGFRYLGWKIEGSSFTGKEPGENRYNFDKPRFDSWSGRLSYNPTVNWAFQASHGFIKEPESLHPGENIHRTTSSVEYSRISRKGRRANITALWGMNKAKDHSGEHGALVEGSQIINRTTIYARYEWVQKSAEELDLANGIWGHDAIFPVHAFTGGGAYKLMTIRHTDIAIGGQLSIYRPDERLASLYGKTPVAGQLYLRLNPTMLPVMK